MAVETFEIEECQTRDTGLTEQEETEYVTLIEQMGLEGQRGLLRHDEETDTAQVIPFLHLDPAMRNQFRAVCPHVTEISRYQGELIPIRVLQIAAFCREQNYFERLEVWSRTQDHTDPLLIGSTGATEHQGERYLLARWGDELWPMTELRDRARESLLVLWEKGKRAALSKIAAFAMEAQADAHLDGNWVFTPW